MCGMCVCVCCRGSKGEGPWELGVETPRPAPARPPVVPTACGPGPGSTGSCSEASLPSWAWLWAAGWHGAGPSAAAVGRSWALSGAGFCGVGGRSELVLLRGRRSPPPPGAARLRSSLRAARGRGSGLTWEGVQGELPPHGQGGQCWRLGSHSGEFIHLSTSCTSPAGCTHSMCMHLQGHPAGLGSEALAAFPAGSLRAASS